MTSERSVYMDNFVAEVIEDVHFKMAKIVAPEAVAASAILSSVEDFLAD